MLITHVRNTHLGGRRSAAVGFPNVLFANDCVFPSHAAVLHFCNYFFTSHFLSKYEKAAQEVVDVVADAAVPVPDAMWELRAKEKARVTLADIMMNLLMPAAMSKHFISKQN